MTFEFTHMEGILISAVGAMDCNNTRHRHAVGLNHYCPDPAPGVDHLWAVTE